MRIFTETLFGWFYCGLFLFFFFFFFLLSMSSSPLAFASRAPDFWGYGKAWR